ncbi:hypothetical protein [Adhaeretor mobilis]|uniref:hypothetical protein n=1 Tax=Adhaeretor mobilis TaxID=1930276 RepID=UPI0011A87213|nr:hypothetical protein [Adhaeretor mobilis]
MFDDFKRIAYGCATPCGYAVTALTERGLTPNFHTAALENGNDRVHLLGHSSYRIIAFANPREDYSCELSFRDLPVIAEALRQMFPDVTIATVEELSRPVTKTELELLDRAEIEQVKYWKPVTVGELAFNWWD